MRRLAASVLALLSLVVLGGCRRNRACAPSDESCVSLSRATLTSDGRERTFAFWTPAVTAKPRPLVVVLHGRGGTGAGTDSLAHVSSLAAKHGFALALPDGHSRSWADARGLSPAAKDGFDDVRFFDELVAWFVREQNVDPTRVYVMGISNGGMMAQTIACRSQRVAAVVTIAAGWIEGAACEPTHPTSAMIVMGTHDPVVPYGGGGILGTGDRGRVLSAPDTATLFAKLADCGAPSSRELADVDPADETRTTLRRYGGCKAGAEVLFYSIDGGGHTWPGGVQYLPVWIVGRTSHDFDAGEAAWQFFADKHL